uniref:Uncharacterized protein n=1 Tax=Avena sativa TaxID=4498 RepID=A0ACD5VJM5_AVESA
MATASFVTHLQKPRVLEFRAPPPSPVTGVLTSSSSGSPEHGDGNEDDEVSQFLRCSARVPVLRLPERAIPRKKKKSKAASAPPVIDMRLLEAGGPAVEEALRSAAVAFGCFQVVGHGVDGCLVSGAAAAAVSAAAAREGSPAPDEKEAGGDDDEDGEELWWSPSKGDQSRNRAHDLFAQLEETATQIMDTLQRDSVGAADSSLAIADRNGTSLLCIRTHHGKQCGSGSAISQDDILRTLINTSRCPRALALHLCPGASTFHVFSRRGCSSFRPLHGAVVVTVGDQLQVTRESLSPN